MNVYEIENYKELGLNTPYLSEGPWSPNSIFNRVDLRISKIWTTHADGTINLTISTSAKVRYYSQPITTDEELKEFEWAVLNAEVS